MSTDHRESASREELINEIARLEQMVQAYEKVNAYSERELVKANRMLAAYEEAQDLSPAEINQLQQQMQQGLRKPVPEASGRASLQNRIRAAITEGLAAHDDSTAEQRTPGEVLNRLEAVRSAAGSNFYAEFFRLMVHLDFSDREARVYWDDIIDHTHFLSRAFGRAIPFRVAMLDYFLQRSPLLRNPRIIEMHTFDEVVRTSLQDELTGLYNRRYLDRCLLQEFRRAERHKHPVTIVIFDIDNFKTYNDAFGHPAGDEVMRTIGALMSATFREEDQACRYGGEEFVVILPETKAADALRVAERFMLAVRETRFPHRAITVSGGVADYPASGGDPGGVFLAADQALYQAKHAGKDRLMTAKAVGNTEATRPHEALQSH
ncbi:MAG: GGDEF domain-containing protein [Leptospirales bacterium]|jgi:diguanylate cyclase (GGDEF)-like protein